jgi:hypothetical protein
MRPLMIALLACLGGTAFSGERQTACDPNSWWYDSKGHPHPTASNCLLNHDGPPSSAAPPPLPRENAVTNLPQLSAAPIMTGHSEISLRMAGGTYLVPVTINKSLVMDFIIDSGAADVSIPIYVVVTLIRSGTLKDSDFMGTRTYKMANGVTVPSETFRIRSMKVGDKEIRDAL